MTVDTLCYKVYTILTHNLNSLYFFQIEHFYLFLKSSIFVRFTICFQIVQFLTWILMIRSSSEAKLSFIRLLFLKMASSFFSIASSKAKLSFLVFKWVHMVAIFNHTSKSMFYFLKSAIPNPCV